MRPNILLLGISVLFFWALQPQMTWAQSAGDCDPLVPTHCPLPFPNSYFLDVDPTTPTGFRVALGGTTLPADRKGQSSDPSEWNRLDGFSPMPQIMAHFPGLDPSLLPSHMDLSESIGPESHTLLLDAETLEPVAHWAELDANTDDLDRKILLMYPAQQLQFSHRYIVAMRDLTHLDGTPLLPTPAFASLRDGTPGSDPGIELRRPHYEDLFDTLAGYGWSRESLTLTWDFQTASEESTQGAMLHMRDDALERVGAKGPAFRRLKIEDGDDTWIHRKITGWMRIPLYLESAMPNSRLVLGEDGLPEHQGWAYTHFTMLIPRSLVESGETGRIVQYGHGLFGSQGEVESSYLRQQADRNGWVLIATDWWGMQWADVPSTLRIIRGKPEDFVVIPDRSHQGMVNQVLLMRMAMGRLAQSEATMPAGVPTLDPERRAYYGNSEGGILGGVYMALAPDIERGCVGVHGAPYSVMLMRSKDFEPFSAILKESYPDPMDMQFFIAAIQMLWDRAEPSGYLHRITTNPFPNTPEHVLLQQVALQDHQVHNLASRIFARSVPGTVLMTPATRDIWGLPESSIPITSGSGYTEWDFHQPEAPVGNVPPSEGEDTHEKTRRADTAQAQMYHFFETGEIAHFCDGPCDPE